MKNKLGIIFSIHLLDIYFRFQMKKVPLSFHMKLKNRNQSKLKRIELLKNQYNLVLC